MLCSGGLDSAVLVAQQARSAQVLPVYVRSELSVPFELTLSCMAPGEQQHCGRCSKCREHLEAFEGAGIRDPASYKPIHTRPQRLSAADST